MYDFRPLRDISEQGHDLASTAGLCMFSQSYHGDGAVQTGRLSWAFRSHNVTTALRFIMPQISVTVKVHVEARGGGEQELPSHCARSSFSPFLFAFLCDTRKVDAQEGAPCCCRAGVC